MGLETEAHGTVVVDIAGAGYTMTITVEGLAPNSQYPVNLHGGECPNPEISESATWVDQAIATDDSGTLHFEKAYDAPWEIPADGRTLTVHGRLPTDARTHIACATLTE